MLATALKTLAGLLALLVLLAVLIPNLAGGPHKTGYQAAAIGALKTLSSAQALHREGDKDQDDVYDYGTLEELRDERLIDEVLGSGTKLGYTFAVHVDPGRPGERWMAVASPVPGSQRAGSRHFAINHEGDVFYSADAPFELNDPCRVQSHGLPVGGGGDCAGCGDAIVRGWVRCREGQHADSARGALLHPACACRRHHRRGRELTGSAGGAE